MTAMQLVALGQGTEGPSWARVEQAIRALVDASESVTCIAEGWYLSVLRMPSDRYLCFMNRSSAYLASGGEREHLVLLDRPGPPRPTDDHGAYASLDTVLRAAQGFLASGEPDPTVRWYRPLLQASPGGEPDAT